MASLVFKSRTPEQVYKELLSSTAWIITNYGSGSGVLVHPEEKLVLTNYHVIDNDRSPLVYFPELRGDSLVSEPSAYLGNKASAIKSRVVMRDPGRDLALLRLENLPLKVQPVALAKKSADVGAKLFLSVLLGRILIMEMPKAPYGDFRPGMFVKFTRTNLGSLMGKLSTLKLSKHKLQ